MAIEQLLKTSGERSAGGQGDVAVEFVERAIHGLRKFISELRGEDIPVSFTPKAAPTLVSLFPDDPQEQAILAIIREALRNVRKHAEANAVTVAVRRDTPGIEVQISDDGRGFDPTREPGHFGLTQMRETASDLEGALSIQSLPGEGTTVRFVAPGLNSPQLKRSGTEDFLSKDVEKHNDVDQ
jgi:glucose-6-phosphate-specific signal transduction histidine kinase